MRTTTRPRRIVRRAVMVLVGVVLLVGWYVGSVATLFFLVGAGAMPASTEPVVVAYMSPLERYCYSDLPGGGLIDSLIRLAFDAGTSLRDR